MAGNNNFFNFVNSQSNSNSRNSNNQVSESCSNNQFRSNNRNMANQDRNFGNQRYGDSMNSSTSFSDNSNLHCVVQTHSSPLIKMYENQTCFPQRNVYPFANMLPSNLVQSSSMEHHPPLQNLFPPFNSANLLLPPPPFPLSNSGAPFPPNSGFTPFPPNSDVAPFPPPNPGFSPFTPVAPFPVLSPSIYNSPTSVSEELKPSIQTWIAKRKAARNTTQQKVPAMKLSISEYKSKVTNLATQIKELEKLTTHLQIMSKSLDEAEWLVRKLEVINLKKAVQDTMNVIGTIPEQDMISLLKKRKSKRIRLKRKREEFKELKKEKKAFCQLENSRIDMWLEKMKEQVERTRREEDIKKQADYVLSEVFHKKAEAKRMLSLLTTLGKLRNARIHDRESKGEFVSKEAAETFNSIIENLKKRWLNQINGYNFEEQGLRVMLSDAEVKRSNVEKSLNKQIHNQWLNIIFGDNKKHSSFLNPNAKELIRVRKSWDHFIVEEHSQTPGSSIPSGWILPAPPSNEIWASFLKN